MSKIAMLVADDFEDSEVTIPRARLEEAGHEVIILGIKAGKEVEGKKHKTRVRVDRTAAEARADEFDALVIPGGYSPDHLRLDAGSVRLTREMTERGKLVAAVCHGPQLLIEAGVLKDRTVTSWPSVRKDLESQGAHWIDQDVVHDLNLITSRKPGDLEAFSRAINTQLANSRRTDSHAPMHH